MVTPAAAAKNSEKRPGPANESPGRSDPPLRSRLRGWAFLAARLFMGTIFIYASIDKIAQPAAFAKDIYNYQILPDALVNLAALVLPWLELFLGLCLLAGIWLPGAVLAVNVLLIVFLGALVFNMARGLDVNCGCFGVGKDAAAMSGTYYLTRDIIFFMIGAFLFISLFFRNHRPMRDDPLRGGQRRSKAGENL